MWSAMPAMILTSVEGDDPAAEARARHKAADLHVGKGGAIPMKQYHCGACSTGVELVQSTPPHPQEVPTGWIFPLSLKRVLLVDRRQACQGRDRSQCDRTG